MTWVLITGAGRGIGRDAALHLANEGLRVIATARSSGALAHLAGEARERGTAVEIVELDVMDAGSVSRAAQRVHEITGAHGVDVLVNNAGFGEMGPLEVFDEARIREMFETNVVGLARVTRAFVPAMRERRAGIVINVSSLLGRFTIPAHGPYCATKHAVEAISDALRLEMEPFGVSVVIVEPGSIATDFADVAFGRLDGFASHPDYARLAAFLRRIEPYNTRLSASPHVVSRAIADAIRRPVPRVVVPLSAVAPMWAARQVPRPMYEALLRGVMMGRAAPGAYAKPERALITGAAGGIGSATALRLGKLGVSVVATDVDELALARLARDAKEARLPVRTVAMDVTDRSCVERVAQREDIDVLINNAGYAELGPIEVVGDDAWRAQLAVNVYGPLSVSRAFAPTLRKNGGRIVNVSSLAGIISFPFMGVYCASKFALEALTDALRLELGAFGVSVCAVQPSFIRSGFVERARKTIERYSLDDSPYAQMSDRMDVVLARMDAVGGEPSDVARAIVRTLDEPFPRARYQAPFAATVAASALPWLPQALADRGLARMFETYRLGR